MKILFLIHSFNSLSQRLFAELRADGHEVSIEFDINDEITVEAASLFQPDLILCPYLRRAVPEKVYKNYTTLIIHPGIPGDKGPSALDHAILRNEKEWGVTVLLADKEFDAGPVFAYSLFPMRKAKKSSIYRKEVTEAAVTAVRESIRNFNNPDFRPLYPHELPLKKTGTWNDLCTQKDRTIFWNEDTNEKIINKINSADGQPGYLHQIRQEEYFLYDAEIYHPQSSLPEANPGECVAFCNTALIIKTMEGWIRIGSIKKNEKRSYKLPASLLLKNIELPVIQDEYEISYTVEDSIAYLSFNFYNGAMNTDQCSRLREVFLKVRDLKPRCIVLMGSADFFSNGIHLNTIEHAENPARESMNNIIAMDDLCLAILESTDTFIVSYMQGNAGAGGVFFSLAADLIVAGPGVILNPHYKSMGNLYGSEYWTYLLPARTGKDKAKSIMENRLPLVAQEACRIGLIDLVSEDPVSKIVYNYIVSGKAAELVARKKMRRAEDEKVKPLSAYRDEELEKMKLNFYGFDTMYHIARYNFVRKVKHSRTPLYLANHRKK